MCLHGHFPVSGPGPGELSEHRPGRGSPHGPRHVARTLVSLSWPLSAAEGPNLSSDKQLNPHTRQLASS